MEAIVLVGGLGTRLREIVPDLPKPMAPVAGKPFLSLLLDRLADAGFERIVLATGYKHILISQYFGKHHRNLQLHYSTEDHPLGTGGAIRLAAEQVTQYPVFVLNGDTYLELDYRGMLDLHLRAQAILSVAVCNAPDLSRYGALDIEAGQIRGFLEKGCTGSGVINAGVYLLSPEVLQMIPVGESFSFEQQLLVPRVQEIRPLAFRTEGLFIDIGIPEDFQRAQQLFASQGHT